MDRHMQSTLRWGGLAGILGAFLLIGVIVFLSLVGGLETLEGEAALDRFPTIRWARIIENTAYLFALALWAVHSIALYMALRDQNAGLSLTACVMSVLGLAILATGAIPHTAETVISDLYHAPDTAAELKPVLVIAWEVSMGWTDTLVITGVVLTPVGLLLYGLAMMNDPLFGKWIGWTSVILGLAGGYGAVASLIEEGEIVALGVLAIVVFHLVAGWTSYRRSNNTRPD